VTLEANSLYVSLTQLMSQGFHWSIYVTDAYGTATRYHWRQVRSRTTVTSPIEVFSYETLACITETTRGLNLNLAFVKIEAFTAPRGATPDNYYVPLFRSIFATSYPTVMQNRRQGITCRTWVFAALERL
ncbi:hypothetical protein K435DRAFT_576608, partial [Dendrothele bispora CBS 962.96]